MIVTIIEDIMQAIESERAVLFVSDISKNVVLNKSMIITIRKTCAINSVILMTKNSFSPQSAPRRTSYIELKIKAGRSIKSISVDAFDVNSLFNKFGKKITIIDARAQIIPVKIKPDETIEPIAFLFFSP